METDVIGRTRDEVTHSRHVFKVETSCNRNGPSASCLKVTDRVMAIATHGLRGMISAAATYGPNIEQLASRFVHPLVDSVEQETVLYALLPLISI